jgi:integrase
MARKDLTDRKIKSLKPRETGRYEIMDSQVPGLGVRVSEAGKKTFIFFVRYPGTKHPSRRELGEYDDVVEPPENEDEDSWRGKRLLSLAQARAKARSWRRDIKLGIDPSRPVTTLTNGRGSPRTPMGVVFKTYLDEVVVGMDEAQPLQRKGLAVRRLLEREFFTPHIVNGALWPSLKDVPIGKVTPADILLVIDDAKKRGDFAAFHALSYINTLFNWAIGSSRFGIEYSPSDRIRPRNAIGKKRVRGRILSPLELAALRVVSDEIGYPYGSLYKLLGLTGLRKVEAAEATWHEFDLERRIWTVPASRMKNNAPHVVPLSDEAIALLRSLPRFSGEGAGDYLFSTRKGAKPINGFSKAYTRLRRMMEVELARFHSARGDQLNDVRVEHFHMHDVRRTVRTILPALGVPDNVAERVIAHAKTGLQKVYDLYAYLPEKREALEKLAVYLTTIEGEYQDGRSPSAPEDVGSIVVTKGRG